MPMITTTAALAITSQSGNPKRYRTTGSMASHRHTRMTIRIMLAFAPSFSMNIVLYPVY